MPQASKFFRVATEGATTDGRTISREWISQMAKSFDPKKYGARVWLEHFRGIYPDSPFRAYGDVIAVEAREVEDKKLALFAKIEPLPELVDLTKKKQKIYTSIEVTPKFADTGEAYLTGLAVTDSPASLGTEVLAFAQQKPDASPFKGRKSSAEALFSEAVEVALEFEDAGDEGDSLVKKFSERVKGVLDKVKGRAASDDARFAQVVDGLDGLADAMNEQAAQVAGQIDAQTKAFAALKTAHDKLQADFAAQTARLEGTRGQQHSQRPPATGGSAAEQTDC